MGGLLDKTATDEHSHADEQHHRDGNEVFPLETQDLIDTQAKVVVTLETDAPLQATSCATTSAEA